MLARLCFMLIARVALNAQDKEAALGAQLASDIRKSATALGDSDTTYRGWVGGSTLRRSRSSR